VRSLVIKNLSRTGPRKAAISALEVLAVDQHKTWKKAVDRIKEFLESGTTALIALSFSLGSAHR
jgi:hypothetical protein